MPDLVRLEVSEHIALVTLDAPPVNAQSVQLVEELTRTMDEIGERPDVRVVVLTGAGKVFSAGADMKDRQRIARSEPGLASAHFRRSREAYYSIMECAKPVIGAINGPAVGIGITLTLPMDIRLVAEGAKIGFVFARRGIVPEAASSWFLPRLVGISRAVEWCATGRVFSAEEGLAAGLFRSMHAPDDLLPAARALAAEIAESAPVSVALSRKMMWQGLSMQVPMEAHRIDSRGVYARGGSADAKEGVVSFLEKRAPDYTDRVSTGMPEWFPWWEKAEWK